MRLGTIRVTTKLSRAQETSIRKINIPVSKPKKSSEKKKANVKLNMCHFLFTYIIVHRFGMMFEKIVNTIHLS